MRESRPHLLAQFPALEPVTGEDVTPENYERWLAAMVETLGEWFDVAPMPEDANESIDPLSELAERVHPDRIVMVPHNVELNGAPLAARPSDRRERF